MRKQYLIYVLPLGIYLLAYSLFQRFGYKALEIPWGYYQLLSREELVNVPLKSLYFLHSQPPLLNALLALLLRISTITGCSPEFWAEVLFFLLGLSSTILVFRIVDELTNSLVLAAVSITLILSDPAYPFFQTFYFYPFILHFLLVLFLAAGIRALKTGKRSAFMLCVFLLSLICNTRTLFHPIWAITIYALMAVAIFIKHGEKQGLRIRNFFFPTLVLGLAITIWPLKNYILFDQFTFSTWEGFNIANSADVHSSILDEYLSYGVVPEKVRKELQQFRIEHRLLDSDIRVISESTKSDGSRNWNHYIFTVVNQPLRRQAILYKITNPKQWLMTMASNYFAWTRASFIHPYTGEIRGPDTAMLTSYSKVYQALFFHDIRPFLESKIAVFADRSLFYVGTSPLPFTVFGLLVFPLLMLLSLIIAVQKLLSKNILGFTIMIIPWFTIFWLLLVPVLTDGIEGNRMRFSGTPYLVIQFVLIIKALHSRTIQFSWHAQSGRSHNFAKTVKPPKIGRQYW